MIVSDMSAYGDYLKQAFEVYEIPVFMDQKKSILLNPFVEYIRSLLSMAEQNLQRKASSGSFVPICPALPWRRQMRWKIM